MSKTVRVVFICAYSALLFQLFKSFWINQHVNYLEIDYIVRIPGTLRKINREIRRNEKQVTVYSQFKRPDRLPTDLKYILKWTEAFWHYSSVFKIGQQSFIDHNCSKYNCFITADKSLLTDPKYFDAIIFDVENNWDLLPPWRIPYQTYIFMAVESADNYPICDPSFDSYYNWTWSYKLDSDIRWSYVALFDKEGKVIGPKINMSWIYPMKSTPEHVKDILKTKKKAVAWFASNCRARNKREDIAKRLMKSLARYNLKIDVYGWCGNLTCPKDRIDECLELLRTDYYFYLAFENSNSEDYVTEKILYPLQHYTVPIVYGGADYSRFLPPNSYINAGILDSEAVASLIYNATKNLEEYSNYFRWHNYYTYKAAPPESDMCVLCKLLNDDSKNTSVVKNFRKWWNPKFEKLCKEEQKKKVLEVI